MIYGRVAGPTGKLFMFEPYSVSFGIIKKNAYLNGLGNITTCYNVAASNKKGTAQILVSYENTSGNRISSEESAKLKVFKDSEEVEVNTIDNVMPKDVKIDFALIDVEYLELESLEGMKELIDRSPNLIIVIEWAGHSYHMTT